MNLFYKIVLPTVMPGNVLDEAVKPEAWLRWTGQAGRVVLVLGAAWLLTRLVKWTLTRLRRYTIRMMDRRGEGDTIDLEKRANTLISAFSKVVDLVIWCVALLAALHE